MRSRTVLVSAGIHAALAALALGVVTRERSRAPTAITLVDSPRRAEEKAPPPAPPPDPRPPPEPRPRPPRPAAARAARAGRPPAAAAEPTVAEPALEGDGDPGIALPAAEPPPPAEAAPPPAPPPPPPRAAAPPRRPRPEAECRERPTKPVPIQRGATIGYTTQAQADGAEGRLVLALTVGPDGSVTAVTVKRGVHPSIDAAGVAAARAWRFRPAMRCGKPVEGVYTIARRFEFGD